ncbi:hypothetical protein Q8F55_001109 [Vanrija albida]|uniref:Mid2 domain-containing protein n=1 Tax=Vanrija albida TaxID=181172 RepID=A0ABR3QF55_9TREE
MRLAPVLLALSAVGPAIARPAADKRQLFSISIPGIGNPFATTTPPVVTTTPPVRPTTTPPVVSTTAPASSTTSHTSSSEAPSSSTASSSSVAPSSSTTTTTSSEAPSSTTASSSTTTQSSSSSEASSSETTSTPPTEVTVTKDRPIESSHSASAAPSNAKKDTLSTGAIAGIAVGGGLALLAIIAAIILFARRRRHEDDDAIRWPELNRHGDSSTMAALPAHRTGHHGIDTGPADRRMSLGSDLEGPAYLQDDNPSVSALNGSSFGSPAGLHDYNEKAAYFDPGATTSHHSDVYSPAPVNLTPGEVYHPGHPGSYGSHDDYTSYPPAVRPQPSPVHGVTEYDWEQSQAQDPYGGYVGATRQESPPYPNRY